MVATMSDRMVEWYESYLSSRWDGEVGTSLRHGTRLPDGTVLCFGTELSRVWLVKSELWVQRDVGEELLRAGWDRGDWEEDTLTWLVGVPWRLWERGEVEPEWPKGMNYEAYLRNKKKWPWRQVSTKVLVLRPKTKVEVDVLPGGEHILDPVVKWTKSRGIGVGGAMMQRFYGTRRENYDHEVSGLIVTREARALIDGFLEYPEAIRWEPIYLSS